MTEELIGKLAQIGLLRVISRTSVMRYKGSRNSLPEIARELNVDAVLEGTVQRSDGRVHVTVRLVLAATDSPSWSREYDRSETDVLKLQSELASAVASEIRIQLTADERARLASARNINPQAHEAFLLGQYHLSKNNEQDMNQAVEYFERATQIAPDYAAAYAGLSNARLQRGWVLKAGANYKGVESQSRTAALKAIALDEQLAQAHNSLGRIKLLYDWDWVGAEQEFKRAVELDPGSADAHIFYGHILGFLGSHPGAIREGEVAAQLDPLSSSIQSSLGRILFCAGKYQEALTHQKRAVELEPRNAEAHFRLADVYLALSMYKEAIAAFERVGELTPEFESFRAGIAHVYALMGKQHEARQMIRNSKADPLSIAIVYGALGDNDEAFRILERAVEERSPVLIGVKVVPFLENLHSDPRWQTLLRRMNLPPE
jgi:tetratricopeptide (TPR) repeat protein